MQYNLIFHKYFIHQSFTTTPVTQQYEKLLNHGKKNSELSCQSKSHIQKSAVAIFCGDPTTTRVAADNRGTRNDCTGIFAIHTGRMADWNAHLKNIQLAMDVRNILKGDFICDTEILATTFLYFYCLLFICMVCYVVVL